MHVAPLLHHSNGSGTIQRVTFIVPEGADDTGATEASQDVTFIFPPVGSDSHTLARAGGSG